VKPDKLSQIEELLRFEHRALAHTMDFEGYWDRVRVLLDLAKDHEPVVDSGSED
jgi:hypothetical protein